MRRRRLRSALIGSLTVFAFPAVTWLGQSAPASAACLTQPCNSNNQVSFTQFLEFQMFKSEQKLNPQDGASFEETSDFTNFMQTGQFGTNASGPAGGHLGMYVNGSPDFTAWGIGGVGAVVHGDGLRFTDTTGALAPGTIGPSVRNVTGGGGLNGVFDATRFLGLPAGQSLTLKGFFGYDSDAVQFGLAPGAGALAVGNGGSLRADTYTFGGSAFYGFGASYLHGTGSYSFGHANETNTVTASTGGFNTSGYAIDARLGHIFTLMNTSAVSNMATMPTKAPPKSANGTFVGLDLSAHLGVFEGRGDGFIDSTGFVFGSMEARYGDVGGRARVLALMRSGGITWMPYISGTVDQNFAVSNVQNIPSQAALAGGDVITAAAAKTFWGTDIGLNAFGPGGWSIGVQGFYQTSSDINAIGGMATLKIPFNSTSVAARY
jgi:hypothetical protein